MKISRFLGWAAIWGCLATAAVAQQTLPLADLSAFRNPSANWRIVGDAAADISQQNVLLTSPGTGILACIHEQGRYGTELDLVTKDAYGDFDLELDFMMAKGSNSGIYLQGRYEIQLLDSWGKRTAKYNDVGGIYERWNDALPEGQKGYEGYAPRLNAAKAPGLWQHLKISFQAPRFEANGRKTANARILKIELNGQLLHENVELSGVTRGAMSEVEVATGPLRLQGDHGSVAFRNIRISDYNRTPATLKDITYKVVHGSYSEYADLNTLPVAASGKAEAISWEVSKNDNDYVIYHKATLVAPAQGNYIVTTQISGSSELKINGKPLLPMAWTVGSQQRAAQVALEAGEHTLELLVNKRDGWLKPTIGLWVAGPGFRGVAFHTLGSTLANKPADPIIVSADMPRHLRSFMDIKDPITQESKRLVHTISVGHPSGIHYTYDLDKGSVVQVWRGGFLDATPMWDDRGDGSSRPLGSVTVLSTSMSVAGKPQAQADTLGTSYRPRGYQLDEANTPTFLYDVLGGQVTDALRVKEDAYFTRELSLKNTPANALILAAEAKEIQQVGKDLYAVGDKSFFIRLPAGQVATIKNTGTTKQLLLTPQNGKIAYDILF